mgnify:CR=1 FL=1
MNRFVLIKFKIIAIVALLLLFPVGIFAQVGETVCSPVGYSVFTINGIFTNEERASKNRDKLWEILPPAFNHQPLTVDFLLNPSHLAGLGDLVISAYQKVFDNETVKDYDLVEMLKDASAKVKTQKLLLVAHSQGNFYANSFYDTAAGKEGGVPAESIGVYAVATPAGRVAGGGKWLTSETDKVIADWVSLVPFKKIMAPNTNIVLDEVDNSKGHNFSGVYLKHRGSEIVSNIQASLDKLQTNDTQNESSPCLASPKLTLAHKVEGKVLAVVDPKAKIAKDGFVIVAKETYQAGKALAKGAYSLTSLLAGAVASVLPDDKPPIKTYSLWVGTEENITPADNSQRGTLTVGKIKQAEESLNDMQKKLLVLQNQERKIILDASLPLASTIAPVLSNIEEKKPNAATIRDEPRIFFVGMVYPGFGGGGEGSPRALASASESLPEQSDEQVALSAPSLSAPQCAYSLATDGCLVATTTVIFVWPSVSGATYYAVNKNGEYATTTDLFFSADIPDFSDYVFSVSAGNTSTTSDTSTQTVSVATIPIAINEIAWMGTTASAYDEWLELKNNTGHRINLSQWAIESADNLPYIALAGEMSPYEYRVLERRANTITARAIVSAYGNGSSQWALGNSGEELILSYASTTLDKSPAIIIDAWTAGGNTSSTTRKTMERIDSKQSGATSTNWATWGTNIAFIKNGNDTDGNQISGTPGECNSISYSNLNNGQNITSDLTLTKNDCYYTSAGSSISATSTLAIEEGVRISLYQNNLVVNGIIIAGGTLNNPIIIDSFSGTPTSNRITISGANGTSSMDNVIISNTGGIYLNNSASLEIFNAEFANNQYGIELNNGSTAIIENVNFASTTQEALSAYNGSSISVASSTISNTIDADAIGVYNSRFSMASTTIDIVYSGDGIGAYDSTVSIASSTISNILDGDGLELYNSTTTISNAVVENVSGDGIAVYGGNIAGDAVVEGEEEEWRL